MSYDHGVTIDTSVESLSESDEDKKQEEEEEVLDINDFFGNQDHGFESARMSQISQREKGHRRQPSDIKAAMSTRRRESPIRGDELFNL